MEGGRERGKKGVGVKIMRDNWGEWRRKEDEGQSRQGE